MALTATATLLLAVAVALAALGSLTRLEEDRDPSSGGSVEGLDFAEDAAVSPDGAHVYVTGANDSAVVTFARASSDGALTRVEEDRDPPGGSAEGLSGAFGVAVSPDGGHVYVASLFDDAVVTFSRNASTGALTRIEEDRDPSSGGLAEGLDRAVNVAVSPDGGHVYVTGSEDDAVVTFSRNAATGALTRIEEDRDPSSGGAAEGLDFAEDVAVSPDGNHVYVTAQNDDAVVTFSRNSATGALTRVEEDRDPSSGGAAEGLDGAHDVAVSADGAHVYVSGNNDDTVVTFSRNSSTGALARVEEDRDPSSGGSAEGLDGAFDVASSPGGANVYVSGQFDDAVVTFSRDSSTGALTRVEEDRDPPGGSAEGLDGATGLALSADDTNAYVTAGFDDTVVTFTRDTGGGGGPSPTPTPVPTPAPPGGGGAGEKRATATQVICNYIFASRTDTCTATVGDASGQVPGTPSGQVKFTSANGGLFLGDTCNLSRTPLSAVASCSAEFIPPANKPLKVTATYLGDSVYAPSSASTGLFAAAPGAGGILSSITPRFNPPTFSPPTLKFNVIAPVNNTTVDATGLVTDDLSESGACASGKARTRSAGLASLARAGVRRRVVAARVVKRHVRAGRVPVTIRFNRRRLVRAFGRARRIQVAVRLELRFPKGKPAYAIKTRILRRRGRGRAARFVEEAAAQTAQAQTRTFDYSGSNRCNNVKMRLTLTTPATLMTPPRVQLSIGGLMTCEPNGHQVPFSFQDSVAGVFDPRDELVDFTFTRQGPNGEGYFLTGALGRLAGTINGKVGNATCTDFVNLTLSARPGRRNL